MRITVERSFEREARKLPPDRTKAAADSLVKFSSTPDLPSLNFRALQGSTGHYLINARRGDRIVLRKEAEDHFSAVDVGPHDNIYRRWNR